MLKIRLEIILCFFNTSLKCKKKKKKPEKIFKYILIIYIVMFNRLYTNRTNSCMCHTTIDDGISTHIYTETCYFHLYITSNPPYSNRTAFMQIHSADLSSIYLGSHYALYNKSIHDDNIIYI